MSNRNLRAVARSFFAASLVMAAAAATVQAQLPKGKPLQEFKTQMQLTATTIQLQIAACSRRM